MLKLKGNWKSGLLAAALLVAVFALPVAGYAHDDAHVFEGWEGNWTSMTAPEYLDSPEMTKFFDDAATAYNAKAPNSYTGNGAKGWFLVKRETRFNNIKIEGDVVTYYVLKDGAPKELGKVVYEPMGKREITTKSGKVRTWYLFKRADAGDTTPTPVPGSNEWESPLARYNYLAFFKVHDSSQPVHFHLRYGFNVDANIFSEENANWYPAVVKEGTTAEQVAMDDSAEDFAAGMPKPLTLWDGEWISMAAILGDAEMNLAYEKIAAEVKKLGGDASASEVRDFYISKYSTDFDRLIVKDGTSVTLKRGDEVIASDVTYTNDGTEWINGSNADWAKIHVHTPRGHGIRRRWYLQYGKDIGSRTWRPTFFEASNKDALVDYYVTNYSDGAVNGAKNFMATVKK